MPEVILLCTLPDGEASAASTQCVSCQDGSFNDKRRDGKLECKLDANGSRKCSSVPRFTA
jgi:hypothetical protein